jgi:hypothetical protein
MNIKREVWKGAVEICWGDGLRWRTERDVLIRDDWRDTVFGPVNFGETTLGPTRWIVTPDSRK